MQCYHTAAVTFHERDDRDECNCLPSCTTLTYEGHQSIADYDLVSVIERSVNGKDFNLTK